MKYETGDIIRFKHGVDKDGLFEITSNHGIDEYDYTITNDECNSESYAKGEEIILVCSVNDRKDLSKPRI